MANVCTYYDLYNMVKKIRKKSFKIQSLFQKIFKILNDYQWIPIVEPYGFSLS